MNKRLEMLEKLVKSGSADAFAEYALGLEYKKLGRHADALASFTSLRERDATYVPVYLMAAQLLVELGEPAKARLWLEEGLEAAAAKGDSKALGELQDLLGEVQD
ncbi:MAG: tetratricopeptide repeat protein [Polyangiaceae bacterium]|nr:tetratricopeptide repeat protein [Polyangiaceae bacterium]